MYQALYRKWRPRTFDDVVGQDHITATLKKQVATDRLSHAYLFIGTRGTGKTTCAKILARAVNCENPQNGNPCNECASCRGILDGSILDVVELDAASNNGVSDVRALQDEAIFSPASVRKRVYIIDEVHMLSTAAFNALLKILEEPPAHLMFILCTTELHKVLPTIVSRCQRHSFKRIEPDAIAGRLSYVAEQEGMQLTEDAAALLARLADGGMRDALSLLDQCAAGDSIDLGAVHNALGLAGSRRIQDLLEAVIARDPQGALAQFDTLWKDGKDPAGILEELGDLMRDILLLHVAPRGGDALLSGLHDADTLRRFAARTSGPELMDAMDAIRAADLAGQNPRRAAELCLVKLCVPETGDSLAGLKSRVSRLEAAMQAVPGSGDEPLSSKGMPATVFNDVASSHSSPPRHRSDAGAEEGSSEIREIPEADTRAAVVGGYTSQQSSTTLLGTPSSTASIRGGAEECFPETETPFSAEVPAQTGREQAPEPDPDIWPELVKRMNGKLDLAAYSMLCSAQTVGALQNGVMRVFLATPIARMMLDKPEVAALLQRELASLTGQDGLRVQFTDQPLSGGTPAEKKLDALKKFPNVKFE